MLKHLLVLLIYFLVFINPSYAIYDPLSVKNNKFGIHIINENDLQSASHLVNSSGGDWGYVTMVISEEERKLDKWTNIFNEMKRLHLIPIIRIATTANGNSWQIPKESEVGNWVEFLHKLPWPIKNRYVVIYNEPNHAKEWGGIINPENYSKILELYHQKLKEKSTEFFILPAGLDASAANTNETMDEILFLRRMLEYKADIFDKIDGWTSHSYPNPGFKGKVEDYGRGTLRNYIWEINLIKNLGLNKNLPVFITETGWQHNQVNNNLNYPSPDVVAQNMIKASETVWQDNQIVVVSPFLLNYQSDPFAAFSWQKIKSDGFYPQYDAYRSIVKIPGNPILTDYYPTLTPEIDNSDVKGETTKINQDENFNILVIIWQFLKRLIV